MPRVKAHRIATRVVAATTSVGFVGLLALPAVATAAPIRVAVAHTASWFHDPVSAVGRRSEVAVPADPSSQVGLRQTKATFRTQSGSLSVPATWAYGHALVSPEALTLTGQALFAFNSPTPTGADRTELRKLIPAFSHVRAITCEGYTDFGGNAAHQQTLSLDRAGAICALIHADRPGIRTTVVGYGGSRPVIVGGTAADRAQNRRVILVATASTPLDTVPGPPHLSTAVAGDKMATVTFQAPTRSGGTKITGYRVSINGGRTWHKVPTKGGGPFVLTMVGLVDGTTYGITFEAVNAVGHSVASNRLSVTPRAELTVASAPVLSSANPGDGRATLRFSAPASNGGAAITGYEVSTNGGITWTPVATVGSGPYTTMITGLTDGTAYAVTVRAVNSVGDSAASNSISVTPEPGPTVPDAPTLIAGTADTNDGNGPGFGDLTFTTPADGGSAITDYQYSLDGTSWSELATFTPGTPNTATAAINYDPCNDTIVDFYVRAVNVIGDGAASSPLPILFPAGDC
jgi:outer membrane protein OmpA-like peptidoglycan-associated protein